MSRRWITGGRARATRAVLVLVAALACLGAAAYAASGPRGAGHKPAPSSRAEAPHPAPGKAGPRPPRPRISGHPALADPSDGARFAFSAPGPGLRFQCRLDRGAWKRCRSPLRVSGLAVAPHTFKVRAVRAGRHGRAARFAWTRVEPRPLLVEPRSTALAALLPGAPPQAVPVRIANPNPVPVTVTAVTVAIAADPPGCPANPNFELSPAAVSPAAPLVLPAGAELTLPTATVAAPAIALRDLPVNQDACEGVSFPLRFAAEGQG